MDKEKLILIAIGMCGPEPTVDDNEFYAALDEYVEEKVKRREQEIYLMMEASYAKGWDFERFLKTFAQLILVKNKS